MLELEGIGLVRHWNDHGMRWRKRHENDPTILPPPLLMCLSSMMKVTQSNKLWLIAVNIGKRLICNSRWTQCISQPYFDRVERESCLLLLLAGRCSRTLYVEKDILGSDFKLVRQIFQLSGECDWILPLPNIRLPNPWSYLLHRRFKSDMVSGMSAKQTNESCTVCMYLYIF